MFKSVEQKEAWMEQNGLFYGPEGQILDDEDGLYNPYCYEKFEDDTWKTMMGVQFTQAEAKECLEKLRAENPGTEIRCFRANEVESESIMPW